MAKINKDRPVLKRYKDDSILAIDCADDIGTAVTTAVLPGWHMEAYQTGDPSLYLGGMEQHVHHCTLSRL